MNNNNNNTKFTTNCVEIFNVVCSILVIVIVLSDIIVLVEEGPFVIPLCCRVLYIY